MGRTGNGAMAGSGLPLSDDFEFPAAFAAGLPFRDHIFNLDALFFKLCLLLLDLAVLFLPLRTDAVPLCSRQKRCFYRQFE